MNRRSLLRAGVASLPLGLAGCSSIMDGDGGGNSTNDAGATTTASTAVKIGETQTLDDHFEVTVEDVTFRESVFYPSDEDDEDAYLEAYGASSNDVIAVVTVTVENIETRGESLGFDTFQLEGGEWYRSGDDVPHSVVGFDAVRFTDGAVKTVDPGETVTGYYLAKVPREKARETVRVNAKRNSTSEELTWEYPPANGSERPLPNVHVESVSVPESPMTGLEYDVEFTVANDGDADGVFRGSLQWQGGGQWKQLTRATGGVDLETRFGTDGAVRATVPAGETTTVPVTTVARYPQVINFRARATAARWQTEFQPATLTFGDRIRVDEETFAEVRAMRVRDVFETVDDDGEKSELESDQDRYFVAVQYHWERADPAVAADSPGQGDFTIGTKYVEDIGERVRLSVQVDERWYSPVAKSLENHTEVTGWYTYSVSNDFDPEDLRVRYEGDVPDRYDLHPLRAEWTQA